MLPASQPSLTWRVVKDSYFHIYASLYLFSNVGRCSAYLCLFWFLFCPSLVLVNLFFNPRVFFSFLASIKFLDVLSFVIVCVPPVLPHSTLSHSFFVAWLFSCFFSLTPKTSLWLSHLLSFVSRVSPHNQPFFTCFLYIYFSRKSGCCLTLYQIKLTYPRVACCALWHVSIAFVQHEHLQHSEQRLAVLCCLCLRVRQCVASTRRPGPPRGLSSQSIFSSREQ